MLGWIYNLVVILLNSRDFVCVLFIVDNLHLRRVNKFQIIKLILIFTSIVFYLVRTSLNFGIALFPWRCNNIDKFSIMQYLLFGELYISDRDHLLQSNCVPGIMHLIQRWIIKAVSYINLTLMWYDASKLVRYYGIIRCELQVLLFLQQPYLVRFNNKLIWKLILFQCAYCNQIIVVLLG